MSFGIEFVGKIGSMALINSHHDDIDYNIFARIGRQLRPGMIWVSSGATEIGRLDYLKRAGAELDGDIDEAKTDYASQGQAILMQTYRDFIDPKFGIRQILVEHSHFNDTKKRDHIKGLLLRAASQNTIPIINYNDAVSGEENRKMEIRNLIDKTGHAVELVDNDETAAQIACLVNAKNLVILSGLDGIYYDVADPSSLIQKINATTADEVLTKIDQIKARCVGASRQGANGAAAKLEYIKPCVIAGTTVFIASAKYSFDDILSGKAPSTKIEVCK